MEDAKFRQNIQGATNAGLKVGVYFFTQAVNEVEAVEEASMVLSQIKNYKISYPVFIDVESSGGRADGLDAAVYANWFGRLEGYVWRNVKRTNLK